MELLTGAARFLLCFHCLYHLPYLHAASVKSFNKGVDNNAKSQTPQPV